MVWAQGPPRTIYRVMWYLRKKEFKVARDWDTTISNKTAKQQEFCAVILENEAVST